MCNFEIGKSHSYAFERRKVKSRWDERFLSKRLSLLCFAVWMTTESPRHTIFAIQPAIQSPNHDRVPFSGELKSLFQSGAICVCSTHLVREYFSQSADCKASCCSAKFWSSVETRSYPINIIEGSKYPVIVSELVKPASF